MSALKRFSLGVFALALSFGVSAQDIHFSQFYLSPLNLNPALTGVMNCNTRITANYRNQWASVLRANAYNTYSVSYDQRIPVARYDFFGLGATFWGDRAGESNFSTLSARLAGSYSKRMGGGRSSNHYLVFGVEGGVSQRSIDFLNLRFGSQHDGQGGYDGTLPSGERFDFDNFFYIDASAGLLWFSVLDDDNSFYAGGAYYHLNRADQSFVEDEYEALYSKYVFHAGGEFAITPRVGILPGIVSFVQGPSFELNTGASARFVLGSRKYSYSAFQAGLWFRIANHFENPFIMDALILSTRFDYNQFTLGFSYDINVSSLKAASNANGAFEFALNYKICPPVRRGIYCPTNF